MVGGTLRNSYQHRLYDLPDLVPNLTFKIYYIPLGPGPGQGPAQSMGPGPGQGPARSTGPGPDQGPARSMDPGPGQGPARSLGPGPGQGPARSLPNASGASEKVKVRELRKNQSYVRSLRLGRAPKTQLRNFHRARGSFSPPKSPNPNTLSDVAKTHFCKIRNLCCEPKGGCRHVM